MAGARYKFQVDTPNADVEDITIDVWGLEEGEVMYLSQRVDEWVPEDMYEEGTIHTQPPLHQHSPRFVCPSTAWDGLCTTPRFLITMAS